MSRPSIAWYVRRLRGMSMAEVLHRSGDAGRRVIWSRRQVRLGDELPPSRRALANREFSAPLADGTRERCTDSDVVAVVEAADRVLEGTWTVLGVRRPDSAEPDWFRDPISERRAPNDRLAFRIHHRDEAETGNIKQVWEMSRHHHLTVLATAWWLTGDERYADATAAQLRSWWQANPFLTGVHWTSGIEAGIRLISWTWIRRLLDDWPKVGDLFEYNEMAVRQIEWHQEFLAAFRSRGSSANNHVIAEAAGLLTAACAFPWYGRSAVWRKTASELLARELDANTFADGVNRELATDYHRFVCELGLVAAVEADASGHPLPDRTWTLLGRMLDSAAAMLDVRGAPPRQGDGDEGRALILDDPERDPWAGLLATGSAILGSLDWWPPVSMPVEATLLSTLAHDHPMDRMKERPRLFPDAGMAILRSRPADGPELWCRCDGGPHGFLSIAAHAHADALSLELRHDGVEILVDPGTYCYHGEPEWREWFRSTAAHNTVELGGVSQAESGGPFLWSSGVKTTVAIHDLGDKPVQTWVAEHDGYRRLSAPATHRRSVILDSASRRLTITDDVGGNSGSSQSVRMFWHLGPAVGIDFVGNHQANLTWQVGSASRTAILALPESLSWTVHRGETNPVRGWYSPGFGHRVPTSTLIGIGTVGSRSEFVTALEFP